MKATWGRMFGVIVFLFLFFAAGMVTGSLQMWETMEKQEGKVMIVLFQETLAGEKVEPVLRVVHVFRGVQQVVDARALIRDSLLAELKPGTYRLGKLLDEVRVEKVTEQRVSFGQAEDEKE